jgi:O-antigen/teichoic acid export membrane protein
MPTLSAIVPKLPKKLPNRFVRNLSWLGLAEIISRVFRLGLTVILARFLTPYDYGLAAIVSTVNELMRVFMEIGVNAKIVQCDRQELESICNSGYWLNWSVFTILFIAQCLIAFPIAWFYRDRLTRELDLIMPICVAGIPYLIWPLAAIQSALIVRENRLKVCAIAAVIRNLSSYILSALFAIRGWGIWSFVLPWVLVTPLEIMIYRKSYLWQPTSKFTTKAWRSILEFGKNICGVQLLKALRNNLDYLIVGRFLGIKELGTYFFGFNAGLGISLSIVTAINTAILPHLCKAKATLMELHQSYYNALKVISLIIFPLVILQSSLAPLYVPIIFGRQWIVAIPILILICLSAIPRPFADAASQLLVAVGKPNLDLYWNLIFTIMFAISLLIGVHWDAIGVAAAVLSVHIIFLPMFTIWTTRYIFRQA